MLDPIAVDVTAAIATLVAPVVFLATLAVAGWRRYAGSRCGRA